MEKELMNIVITGHVDHGKSTVMGRLFADTGSLPEGKLESIQEKCKRESKTFEYAFLLDALKDEQSQGITIDSARAFFSTDKRDYLIIDAPGHIEFLKNMISGAARAEAALLVIDAKEGVRENSKRHGYMLSLLGIKQILVVINKMDLVDYDKAVFESVKAEYGEFLAQLGVEPLGYIPVSATEGENIAVTSKEMDWFSGDTVLTAIDLFEKEKEVEDLPFRMPVQDIYRFTKSGDDRRIIAGRVESGKIRVGDDIVFLPSGKKTRISSIEGFNEEEKTEVPHGYCTGFTMEEQVYVGRGDLMCKASEPHPKVSTMIKANVFWMGKAPMDTEKRYFLKIETQKTAVKLRQILKVLDASDLSSGKKEAIERHDVAECILETENPIAFDLTGELQNTSRFVIVDEYDLAGGGIIVEAMEDPQKKARDQVILREEKWYPSGITEQERAERYGQRPKLILLTGPSSADKKDIAKAIERKLFETGRKVYYIGIGNLLRGLNADIDKAERSEHVRRLGEVSHLMMDAGLIVIATASDLTASELKLLKTIIHQDEMVRVYVDSGTTVGDDVIDLDLAAADDPGANAEKVIELLRKRNVMFSL